MLCSGSSFGLTAYDKSSHFFTDIMEMSLNGLLNEHHDHPVMQTPDLGA